jgi:hypothetical protein
LILTDDAKAKAKNDGVRKIISKPVLFAEMAAVIHSVFDYKVNMECVNG